MDDLEVFPLHHRDMYREACCNMINEEWKRSHTARMLSLKKSCDSLPTSLVMVNNKVEVVGHSRLSPIPSLPDACFVESVVVDKAHRGKGWGRRLMLETEDYARSCGIQNIYLSALPPVPAFYSKLGYSVCEPVSIYGGPIQIKERCSPSTLGECPPPPPPMPNYTYRNLKTPKVYMKKTLYDVEL